MDENKIEEMQKNIDAADSDETVAESKALYKQILNAEAELINNSYKPEIIDEIPFDESEVIDGGAVMLNGKSIGQIDAAPNRAQRRRQIQEFNRINRRNRRAGS